MPAKIVTFSESGGVYKASLDNGPKFEVGRRVKYGKAEPTTGLSNIRTPGAKYNPADHAATHGFWAYFIFPTCTAESNGAFNCLNTYDRAFFTFTFLQYAAHVPNGDFVRFLRRLLEEPEAADYFPDLLLHNGRVARDTPLGPVALESDTSTRELMTYLNPTVQDVESAEVINAAKFIHWSENSAAHRAIQVETGIAHFQAAMQSYAKRYSLAGRLDQVCLAVADIRHQGRGSSQDILAALNTSGDDEKAYRNLLQIGATVYKQRTDTIDREVKKLVAAGILGQKRWPF
ncbi:MAG: hypothetical protein JNK48_04270 [Bryobacterales bacterium]|nr:hypothetical protein [Bryobacterales bacterium]